MRVESAAVWLGPPASAGARSRRSRLLKSARDRAVRVHTVFACSVEASVSKDRPIRLRRVRAASLRPMRLLSSGRWELFTDVCEDPGEELLEREDAAERDVHAAHRDFDDGADLEQPAADRGDLRTAQRSAAKGEPAQVVQDQVGDGREPQAQLVAAERVRAGAVGEEAELLLLDAVLISPRAQYRSS